MQELITKKVEEITANGKLDEIVTKEVTAAIQNTVRDVLRSYGDVGKALENKLKNDIMAGIDKLDFIQYSQSLLDLISSTLNKSVAEFGIEPAKEMLNKFVGSLEKKEWKLSEIIEKFKESEIDDDSHGESGEITLIVRPSSYGSVWIGFDFKGGVDYEHRCKYRISVDEKDKKLWYFTNEKEKLTPLSESNLSGFDLFLFKLYACQCTVIVDESDCDLEWSTYD
jgi:hypothetical protein